MNQKLLGLDRKRLGLIGIGLAVVLFLAVNLLADAWLTTIAPRSHRGSPVHALRGHQGGLAGHRRAGRSAPLLHPAARRARALFQQPCAAGRRAARGLSAAVRRQGPGRAPRSGAVLARGGPGRRRGPRGAADQRRRHARLLRPDRAQLDRRPRGDPLPRAGTRQLPRVRPDPDDRRPRQPGQDRGRGAGRPAADGRRRSIASSRGRCWKRCTSSSTSASSAASRTRSTTTSRS